MILPIILVLGVYIFGWRYISGIANIWREGCQKLEVFTGVLVAALVLGFCLSAVLGLLIPLRWVEQETVQLISLDAVDGTSHGFYIGSGIIDKTPYIIYYSKDTISRGILPGRIEDSDLVTVIEEDRVGAELRVLTDRFDSDLEWLFLQWKIHTKYEFVIPIGGLKEDFVFL